MSNTLCPLDIHINRSEQVTLICEEAMNETAVLNFLKKQTKAVLLDLLSSAFHEMNSSRNVPFLAI